MNLWVIFSLVIWVTGVIGTLTYAYKINLPVNKNIIVAAIFWVFQGFIYLEFLVLVLEVRFLAKRKWEKYLEHLIVSVDFDDTLCRKGYPHSLTGKQTFLNYWILNHCKDLQKQGHAVILNTLREEDLLEDALSWCSERKFIPDYANENTEYAVKKWDQDPRKIASDIHIDDKTTGSLARALRMGF